MTSFRSRASKLFKHRCARQVAWRQGPAFGGGFAGAARLAEVAVSEGSLADVLLCARLGPLKPSGAGRGEQVRAGRTGGQLAVAARHNDGSLRPN